MRQDLSHISQWVEQGARVLDLGCGDGEFLSVLKTQNQVRGMGIEIDPAAITTCISKGLNVVEQNVDDGLANFADDSFDVVVMAHALQAVRFPHLVLDEMLRIGRESIVTFPNFGQWRCRVHLATRGRMPVSRFLPYTWYDTPNIHFCTVRDFETLCRERGIRVLGRHMIGGEKSSGTMARRFPNLWATTAIYHITR